MWIYDGEEWIEEGVNEREKKTDRAPEREEEFYPELDVMEIPFEIPKTNRIPPPPMP